MATMNYDKLWKLLIDKKMMKKGLIEKAGISTNAMAKMGKAEMFQRISFVRYV
jgi:putative transcriptional regulator